MRIIFLGTGDIGLPAFRALPAAGHEVAALFTQPDRPAGRDLRPRPPEIKRVAGAAGIPVRQPERIRAVPALEELRAFDPEIVVVAAYGQILPRALLELPPRGCLNLHASLLPRHRGASPVHAAILAGDTESGITVMQMDEGLDTGDVILRRKLSIGPRETAGELHDRLAEIAPAALLDALSAIAGGTARREVQNSAEATYAPKLSRADGVIDWRLSAVEIDRRIRGLTPWPGASLRLPDGAALKVRRADFSEEDPGAEPGTVLPRPGGDFRVAAADGIVILRDVQAAGGKRMRAADFLRGHPLRDGERLPLD